jgi:archaemetzincin
VLFITSTARVVAVLAALICFGCTAHENRSSNSVATTRDLDEQSTKLAVQVDRVKPFFRRMEHPGTSDWLASHNEPGQIFDEYLALNPKVPERNSKIYILPLGKFTQSEMDIVAATVGFLSEFYGLPVQKLPERPLVPDERNSRKSRGRAGRQVRTGYVLDKILKPAVPKDAAALLAFTNQDLYRNEGTNYLFGQGDFDAAVGVWSLARLRENANRDLFLVRTLKIAVHEAGHLFSIRHCTAYECVMSGTNHLAETDRRPLDACPNDTAKICWFSKVDPIERYKKLAAYCSRLGLVQEAKDYEKKAIAVAK